MREHDSAGAEAFAVQTYVALGDSFSEGVGDSRADGSWRGWADRAAERMAASSPGLRYANLAIRGKVLVQVIEDQVPAAVAMRPDLISLAAGGNDLLRPGTDPDILAQPFNDAVERLAAAAGRVLLFTGFDPGLFPLIRMIRGKAAAFNAHLRIIAARHDCLLVDLWSMRVLADPRMWAADRLHLGPEGHRRVALRVCEVLGLPVDADWREPLPAVPGLPRATAAPRPGPGRAGRMPSGRGPRRALGAAPPHRGVQWRRPLGQAPRAQRSHRARGVARIASWCRAHQPHVHRVGQLCRDHDTATGV